MILIADSYTRREKLVVIETGKTEEGPHVLSLHLG